MKNLKCFALIVTLVLGFGVNGQRDFNPFNEDFYAYKQRKISYYDSLSLVRNGNLKGTGHTQFKRWVQYWDPIVINEGGFINAIEARNSALKTQTEKYTNSHGSRFGKTTSTVTEIGPINVPLGNQVRILGAGRLHFLEFDDVNNRVLCGSPAGGLFYSEDNGDTWINGGMDFLPIIAASHAQIAENVNQGKTWFVATGDGDGEWETSNGIWRTTDKGQTWSNITPGNVFGFGIFPNQFGWARIRKILLDPTDNNILYAATPTGVYKTTNALSSPAAVSWTQVLAPNSNYGEIFFDIQFKPSTNSQTIVVSGKKLYVTNNAGSSWSLIADYPNLGKTTPQSEKALISIRFAESDPDIFYGAYFFGGILDEGRVFQYDFSLGGVSTVTNVGTSYERHQAIGVSPFNENEVLVGNVNNIFRSTDGAVSFPTSNAIFQQWHDDLHWIEFRPNANEIWIANDGGVYKTLDGGATWTNLSDGMGIAIYYHIGSSEARPQEIIGSGWDTGPNLRTNQSTGEFTWTRDFGDAFEALIDDSDPANPIYYTSTNNWHTMIRFSSITGAKTPISVPSSIGARGWNDHFVKASNNQDIIFNAGDKRIGRSINQGTNWEPISFDAKTSNPNRIFYRVWNNVSDADFLYTQRVNFSKNDPNNPDTDDAFALFKSNNAAAVNSNLVTWSDITPVLSAYNGGQPIRRTISMLAVDDEDPNKVWIVYPGYTAGKPKVLAYDGQNWSNITGTGLEGQSVSTIAHQHGTNDLIYVGTSQGIYYKKANQVAWTPLPGVPHCRITDMEINHNTEQIRVSTFGRGIWELGLVEPTNFNSQEVDLFMKDDQSDLGQSPSPGLYTDNGPDIWFRNQDDGQIYYDSEQLIWSGTPFYVYVRVRNKSAFTSSGGTLDLHWSKSGTAFSWPNGLWTNGVDGDLIGSQALPDISAGGSVVLEFVWDMSNHIQSYPNNNITACLLARIENVQGDPIVYKPTLWEDVKHNNNLTMKNLTIREAMYFSSPGTYEPIYVGGFEQGGAFDLNFETPIGFTGNPLYDEAEITFQLDQDLWNLWDQVGRPGYNIDVIDEPNRVILIMGPNAHIDNLQFNPDERAQIGIAVNFLVAQASSQTEFPYVVRQSRSNSEETIGSVHFLIRKDAERDKFTAEAGDDRSIVYSDSTNLEAERINENAVYNWYDESGNKVDNKRLTVVSPKISSQYKLEVISLVDGFKDYDYVQVSVRDLEILEITPNPASSKVEVRYAAAKVNRSAELIVTNVNGGAVNNYKLDPSQNSITLDITAFSSGLYKLILVCDGVIVDQGTLSIN